MKAKLQSLWDAVKAVLRGKLIANDVPVRKEEKAKAYHLFLTLRNLEKKDQLDPETSSKVNNKT